MINIGFFSMAFSVLAQPLSTAIPTSAPIEYQAASEQSMETTYYILRDGVSYRSPPTPKVSAGKAKHLVEKCIAQLAKLGFDVQLTPVAAPAP